MIACDRRWGSRSRKAVGTDILSKGEILRQTRDRLDAPLVVYSTGDFDSRLAGPVTSSLRRCPPSFPEEVEASNDCLWVVGFFERALVAKIARLVGGSGGAGGQDYINTRVMLANPTGKTEAVHSAA
jgi:hypothetical protein